MIANTILRRSGLEKTLKEISRQQCRTSQGELTRISDMKKQSGGQETKIGETAANTKQVKTSMGEAEISIPRTVTVNLKPQLVQSARET